MTRTAYYICPNCGEEVRVAYFPAQAATVSEPPCEDETIPPCCPYCAADIDAADVAAIIAAGDEMDREQRVRARRDACE